MDNLQKLNEEKALLEYIKASNKAAYEKGEIEKAAQGKSRQEILNILKNYHIFSHIAGEGIIHIEPKKLDDAMDIVESKIQKIEFAKHQENLNKSVDRLVESFRDFNSGSKKSFWASVLLVIATFSLVYVTYMMVDSNNQIMNQQMKMAAPILKIWQPWEPDKRYPEVANYFLVQEFGWKMPISLCIRNDGRSSSGAINVRGISTSDFEDPDINVQSTSIENLNPGESNCTLIYIGSMWCPENPDRCRELVEKVPTGYFEIPINITCLYCDEYIQSYKLKFCITPTDDC